MISMQMYYDLHKIMLQHSAQYYIMSSTLQASYRKLFAPKHVWFLPGWYHRDWWRIDRGNKSCTPDIMRRIVNSSLSYTPNGYFVLEDRDMVTFSGLVSPNNNSYNLIIFNRLQSSIKRNILKGLKRRSIRLTTSLS